MEALLCCFCATFSTGREELQTYKVSQIFVDDCSRVITIVIVTKVRVYYIALTNVSATAKIIYTSGHIGPKQPKLPILFWKTNVVF